MTNVFDGTISVIDIATNAVVDIIGVGETPWGITITPDGAFAYVPDGDSSKISVIDISTNTVVDTVSVGDGPLRYVAITPDGAFAYVPNVWANNVLVIDTATKTVVDTIGVGETPYAIAITPDGAFVYVTDIIDSDVRVIATATNAVMDTIRVGDRRPGPHGIAITPDGAFAYVPHGDSPKISVIDIATNKIVATIGVGGKPSGGVAITPDGAFVYVSNIKSNNISVIATATNTVVATIGVGARPWGIAITPDGGFAYVANTGSNNISVIATATNTVGDIVDVGETPISVAIIGELGFRITDVTVLSAAYAAPGVDSVIVTAAVTDPTGLGLFAEFESPDGTPFDTLRLFDDGAHKDGAAGNSVFGNAWPVPSVEEQLHFVDLLVTQVDTDTVSFEINNVGLFTTIGPVVSEDFTIISGDTIPNPGDQITFRLTLRNAGSTATALDIRAELTSYDTCVSALQSILSSFGDLAAGEAITGGGYRLTITQDCPAPQGIPIHISIESEGYPFWSDSFTIRIAPLGIAQDGGLLPEVYALYQNHPNPFNPATTIRYDLPERSHVSVSIYDLLGRQVRTPVRGVEDPGFKSVAWDGTDNLGKPVSAGVYLYRIQAGDFTQTRKMLLLR